jgi:hypothetical protein
MKKLRGGRRNIGWLAAWKIRGRFDKRGPSGSESLSIKRTEWVSVNVVSRRCTGLPGGAVKYKGLRRWRRNNTIQPEYSVNMLFSNDGKAGNRGGVVGGTTRTGSLPFCTLSSESTLHKCLLSREEVPASGDWT